MLHVAQAFHGSTTATPVCGKIRHVPRHDREALRQSNPRDEPVRGADGASDPARGAHRFARTLGRLKGDRKRKIIEAREHLPVPASDCLALNGIPVSDDARTDLPARDDRDVDVSGAEGRNGVLHHGIRTRLPQLREDARVEDDAQENRSASVPRAESRSRSISKSTGQGLASIHCNHVCPG